MFALSQSFMAVTANINYYPTEGGTEHYAPSTASYYKRKWDGHEVVIHDIRGLEGDFTLEKQGFHLAQHPTALSYENFHSEDHIKNSYIPETEELLKRM